MRDVGRKSRVSSRSVMLERNLETGYLFVRLSVRHTPVMRKN